MASTANQSHNAEMKQSIPDGTPDAKRARVLPHLRVGGVPEHFNYPWKIAQERSLFTKHGVSITWVEQKLGTGAMITALKKDECDIIIALMEGLVADIVQGSDVRLLGTYVESPLCWAISTGKDAPYQEVEDLKGQKFGISRFTSGSHLMAFVLAIQRGWAVSDLQFEVKGSFDKLRDSVNDGSTAAFMWETFTTKPFHDSGEIRRLGDITTPWPCFMLASRQSIIDTHIVAIKAMMRAIQEACQIFKEEVDMYKQIATVYGLREEDAKEWYTHVNIPASYVISEAALERTISTLHEAGVLSSSLNPPLTSLVDTRFVSLWTDIKSMRLYHLPSLIAMIHNNLRSIGKSRGELSYRDLLKYDQNHYYGIEALDECIKESGIDSSSRVINIGSSLGGPARYIAGATGCRVLAVELQDDLHATAVELTNRCRKDGDLSQRVHHFSGDFQQVAEHLTRASYSTIVSWLTILHFERVRRIPLFQQCYNLLTPGGVFYSEDFYMKATFTHQEWTTLQREVSCRYLPSLSQYISDLETAGFINIRTIDLTQSWCDATKDRAASWEQHRLENEKIHGHEVYQQIATFYRLIADLFAGGNCGGVRIIAQKPTSGNA